MGDIFPLLKCDIIDRRNKYPKLIMQETTIMVPFLGVSTLPQHTSTSSKMNQ
jgi:hypothetical protein